MVDHKQAPLFATLCQTQALLKIPPDATDPCSPERHQVHHNLRTNDGWLTAVLTCDETHIRCEPAPLPSASEPSPRTVTQRVRKMLLSSASFSDKREERNLFGCAFRVLSGPSSRHEQLLPTACGATARF